MEVYSNERDSSKLSQYYRNLINYAFEVRIFFIYCVVVVFFLLHYRRNILMLRTL